MTEQQVPASNPDLTYEQRISALENQLYVIYLQANAITKLMLDKGVVTHEEVTKEMDDLNAEIFKVTSDVISQTDEAAEAVDEAVDSEVTE